MRKISIFSFLFFLIVQIRVFAAVPFRFAFFTDIHVSVLKPQNAEDLKLAIDEVNTNPQVSFVLIAGDNTDLGDTVSLKIAKDLLGKLKVPYYITTGNHDTGQGKIGSVDFIRTFGADRFSFLANGYQFIGFPTGPVKPNAKGHIKIEELEFVKTELNKLKNTESAFIITHYPLLEGDLDNRMELINLMHKYDVKAVLNGHYHRNAVFNYEGVFGIVNRSTQRAKQPHVGYSIYTVSDSLYVSEKNIGLPEREWLVIPLK
ncbi:MAG: metallophosphoesterase [Paludibacter sp.]